MVRKTLRGFYTKEAVEFFGHVMRDKPLLPFLVPLVALAWAVERWVVPFSNWVPLAVAVWATIQYGRFQRQQLVEDLNQRWKQLILNTAPITPLEPCEWLNKLLIEVWPSFMDPMLSRKFSSIVERRLKYKKPSLLDKIELQEFSLGSCPPTLGSHGAHWFTSGDQRVLRMGFDWDTNDMSIMLFAKLASPLMGTARIVINSIRIKGNLLLMPILDGQAFLYSFESTPEVGVGVVFGSGGSQSLPATELPGVSTWLVKLFTDTLVKIMVEPRRGCFSLPPVNLRKKAVGCVLSVTVISASKLIGNVSRSNSSESRQNSIGNGQLTGNFVDKSLQTFIEVEIEELARRTNVRQGSSPRWDESFNMVLHGESGILKFHLYEWHENGVKFDYLSSCEIKLRYVEDDSTIFWAIGPGSSILAKQAECCGKEVQIVLPLEGNNGGELSVRLVLKEWQYSNGSNGLNNSASITYQPSISGASNIQLRTGRKLKITIMEGRNLLAKSGKCDPYVKMQYGKFIRKTRTVSHASIPVWHQSFEFDEVGHGEYLKVRCYNADMFGDDHIGSATVNLEGLIEGSFRDVWVPLEKVNTGELRLQIEVMKIDEIEGSRNSMKRTESGWIELVIIEARDLIAADLRGTSDPYVRVQYGNVKKRTKVVYKTLKPQWNQTLEFPDTGSPMILHVKDHNALLPTSNIGNCIVEYERLPPNQMADKWIPLQGVKSGEIHIQITRKVPELEKKSSLDSSVSAFSKANRISGQLREMLKKLEGSLGDGDLESLSLALTEVENIEDVQEEYMLQLETEKALLLNKISELCREINSSSPIKKISCT
uniref:Ras GTPase-activating protein 4 n=1 Tax=Anthurium amnicola TaxID=1678845 RepID=A0A1D1Z976_9ARAE